MFSSDTCLVFHILVSVNNLLFIRLFIVSMVAVSGDLVISCFATITKNCSLEHYNNFLSSSITIIDWLLSTFLSLKAIHQTKNTFPCYKILIRSDSSCLMLHLLHIYYMASARYSYTWLKHWNNMESNDNKLFLYI